MWLLASGGCKNHRGSVWHTDAKAFRKHSASALRAMPACTYQGTKRIATPWR